MSRAQSLLLELASRGVSVALEGSKLRLRPRSALTDGLIGEILECKPELVAVLRQRAGCQAPGGGSVAAVQWEILCAVAAMGAPGIGRGALYERIVLPRPLVDRGLAALIARGELRVLPEGGIAINVC